MADIFKLALAGFNASTDTNPDHFSVYYDSTDANSPILIKEKARGDATIAHNSSQSIAHGLSYVPFCLAFMQLDPNTWALLGGDSGTIRGYMEINTTNLILTNTDSTLSHNFKYYIFYDQQI